MWEPDWTDETSAQDDISERYAGERIPPFDHDPDVDPWTGELIKPLIVLLTPDI